MRRRYRKPRLRSEAGSAALNEKIQALRELARVQLSGRQSAQAVSAMEHAVALAPAAPTLHTELAQACWRDGQFERALAWTRHPALLSDPANALLQARILADDGQNAEAIQAFTRALDLAPGKSETLLERATVALRAGALDQARSDLDNLLRRSPGSVRALAVRAHLLMEQGRPDEAIDDLSRIPEAQQKIEHLLLLVQARRQAGQSAESIDTIFRRAAERFAEDARLRLAHARFLAAQRGQDARAAGRAEALLRQLLQSDTEEHKPALEPRLRAQAHFLLAELMAEQGADAEEIGAHYRWGLEIEPEDARGLEGLGRCLLAQGKASQAVHWLLGSVLSDPERPSGIEALTRALGLIRDQAAVRRWLGLLLSALPVQAPDLIERMLQAATEAGRAQAGDDMHREAHRMKNRLAVSASRARAEGRLELAEALDEIFEEWTRFLSGLRRRPPAPRIHAPAGLLRRAVAQAATDPERVRLSLAPGLPLLKADAPALVDAFANLIRNALEASPDEAPVQVALRPENEGHWLRLAVSDAGPGISAQSRERIFEAGYTEGKEGGSGLGLAIARQVIQGHGGRLSVASAPGGPTTFVVMLPAEQAWAPLPGLLIERMLSESTSDL